MSINGKQPMCITAVSVLFLSMICFSILYQARPIKKLNFYTQLSWQVTLCAWTKNCGKLVLVLPRVLTKTIAGTGNEIS